MYCWCILLSLIYKGRGGHFYASFLKCNSKERKWWALPPKESFSPTKFYMQYYYLSLSFSSSMNSSYVLDIFDTRLISRLFLPHSPFIIKMGSYIWYQSRTLKISRLVQGKDSRSVIILWFFRVSARKNFRVANQNFFFLMFFLISIIWVILS